MPTYFILMNWTDQGVRADRDTVGRREHADALAEKYGARIAHAYWTMGHHDIVSVIEAPDDESITGMMLELTAEGNVRTTVRRGSWRGKPRGRTSRRWRRSARGCCRRGGSARSGRW
jgi:uncharacterized protein with GYD domain